MSASTCRKHPLFLRARSVCIVLLVLVVLGMVTRPIEAPAWQVVKARQPEMNLEAIEGALGQEMGKIPSSPSSWLYNCNQR